ncbi:Ankyrin repeat [Dillenia turbinata]|uniref:Ankyrin repeat n=1 Tax=Dillenia turbinata TaxID=194707 RepID=A0AAN8VPL5_9MAGN
MEGSEEAIMLSRQMEVSIMDPSLYKAVTEGNTPKLEQERQLDSQTTPNKSTVLHLAAEFGKTQCVDVILKACPSLLKQVNLKGETALHVAAREGHIDVVKAFVAAAKALNEEIEIGTGAVRDLLGVTNNRKNTASHEAVRNRHLRVVMCLLEEDSEFPYVGNDLEETPLYIAAERGYGELVHAILQACESPAHDGPKGRTALHAAVLPKNTLRYPIIWTLSPKFRKQVAEPVLVEDILRKKPFLVKKADENGRTPLHWAAHFDGSLLIIKLLEYDKSVAYLKDKEGMTALHVAATRGSMHSLKELIKKCPDCIEMVDEKGRNALHLAVVEGRRSVVNYILGNPSLGSLINEEDKGGNTPLHLLAASANYIPKLIDHPKVDKKAVNKAHMTAFDVWKIAKVERKDDWFFTYLKLSREGATSTWRNLHDQKGERNLKAEEEDQKGERNLKAVKEEQKEILKKSGETKLIVATLIATVTFAAGFTVPGGYDGNEGPNHGMAILSKKTAFKAFVVSDTIAMMLSTTAVFFHLVKTLYYDSRKVSKLDISAVRLVILANAAMVIAFMTGMYAVLGHSLALATASLVIAGSFFIFYCYQMMENILPFL